MAAQTFAGGMRAIARKDPVMRAIIKQVGPIELPDEREPFPALVRAIVYQQLAGAAAATILRRVLAIYSKDGSVFPTPQSLLKTPEDKLRAAGLSRQKLSYLKDLSAKFVDGTLTDEKLRTLPDEELEAALISVKGIGRWTTDMFLIFTLHRLDVLPVGDRGVRKGAQLAYKMKAMPTPKELAAFGEQWAPYRSVATLYLWCSLDGPQNPLITSPKAKAASQSTAKKPKKQ